MLIRREYDSTDPAAAEWGGAAPFTLDRRFSHARSRVGRSLSEDDFVAGPCSQHHRRSLHDIRCLLHILKPAAVVEAFTQLGYPIRVAVGLGIVELACTALYAIPRTAALGAVLLTGYLGGAVATQLRVGAGFSTIFPVIVGLLMWAGLALRNARVRMLISSGVSE